jgi:hypothetical protein
MPPGAFCFLQGALLASARRGSVAGLSVCLRLAVDVNCRDRVRAPTVCDQPSYFGSVLIWECHQVPTRRRGGRAAEGGQSIVADEAGSAVGMRTCGIELRCTVLQCMYRTGAGEQRDGLETRLRGDNAASAAGPNGAVQLGEEVCWSGLKAELVSIIYQHKCYFN